MDKILEWEEEIQKRCNEQNIDIDDCYFLFIVGGSYFLFGERVTGVSISKDKK